MTVVDKAPTPYGGLAVMPFERWATDGSSRFSMLKAVLVVLDALALAASWALVLGPLGVSDERSTRATAAFVGAAALAGVILIARRNLYRARVNAVRTAEVAGIAKVCVLLAVGGSLVSLGDAPLEIVEMIEASALSLIGLLVVRGGFRIWLQNERREGRRCRRVLLVGTNDEAAEIAEILDSHPEFGIVLAGVVGDAESAAGTPLAAQLLGSTTEVVDVVRHVGADGVIVAVSAMPSPELNVTVRELMRCEVHVQVTSALRGIDARRLRAQPVAHEPLFHLEPARLSLWQLAVKRGIDVVVSALLLLLVAPVIGALALTVKATDRGGAFFSQERVGRNGEVFKIIKLRTMVVDAEARLAELAQQNERHGPLFKMEHDPRLTRVGRFMDSTSLNELPQLWNVLRGEMSLVGPRPALPSETVGFDDALHARHRVRPGITGLWQVEARDNPAFSAYRRFDLFYVENWSVSLDMVILVATAETVVIRGARALLPDRST